MEALFTPFNCLESIIQELTGKPSLLLGYKSPQETCIKCTFELSREAIFLPYALAIFEGDSFPLPVFFKKISVRTEKLDLLSSEILGNWLAHQIGRQENFLPFPSSSTVYFPVWTPKQEKEKPHLFEVDIYSVPKEEFRSFLNEQEQKGKVSYSLITGFLNYFLNAGSGQPESRFLPHWGMDPQALNEMNYVKKIKNLIAPFEEKMVGFVCQVNSRSIKIP